MHFAPLTRDTIAKLPFPNSIVIGTIICRNMSFSAPTDQERLVTIKNELKDHEKAFIKANGRTRTREETKRDATLCMT